MPEIFLQCNHSFENGKSWFCQGKPISSFLTLWVLWWCLTIHKSQKYLETQKGEYWLSTHMLLISLHVFCIKKFTFWLPLTIFSHKWFSNNNYISMQFKFQTMVMILILICQFRLIHLLSALRLNILIGILAYVDKNSRQISTCWNSKIKTLEEVVKYPHD